MQKQIERFELAHGGAIFFNEVSELSIGLQFMLLCVLPEGEFERLGNPKTIKVDVRVIAAININLEELTEKKLFLRVLVWQ